MRFPKLAVLRFILILHASGVLAQAVFAGEFLSGIDHLVAFHEANGWSVIVTCLVQIILAATLLKTGGGSLGFLVGSIGIFLGEALQVGSGYGRFLSVHVPLGMLIFGGVMWQLAWAFREQPLMPDLP